MFPCTARCMSGRTLLAHEAPSPPRGVQSPFKHPPPGRPYVACPHPLPNAPASALRQAYNVYDDLEGKLNSILPQYDDENMEFQQSGFKLNAEGDHSHGAELDGIRNKLQQSLATIKAEVKAEVKGEGRQEYSIDPMQFGIKVSRWGFGGAGSACLGGGQPDQMARPLCVRP